MSYIPYGKHEVLEEDIKEVVKVLKSDFITQGEMVPKFEKAVSDYCGAKYAKAVNSGTSALHIACLSLGLRSGDYLWTSPISFVASANCGLYCGAKIDFVDINKETYNISIVVHGSQICQLSRDTCSAANRKKPASGKGVQRDATIACE